MRTRGWERRSHSGEREEELDEKEGILQRWAALIFISVR
jgi:hypothetical protein